MEVPSSAEESRFGRVRHSAQATRKYLSAAAGIASLIFLVLLVARNTRQVKVDYVFGSTEARLIWLVLLSAVTGWVLGLATSFLMRRRARRAQ
jgi:uncharacterized integral membrane protein